MRGVLVLTLPAGSGATLRTALALCLATGQDLRLEGLRARSLEVGIGWPQSALLTAAMTAFDLEVSGNEFGSTTVELRPSTRSTWGQSFEFALDLDERSRTFRSDDVRVARERDAVEDAFSTSVNNVNGRGIRGHAAATPLLAVLPIASISRDAHFVINGGTETPGAPFADSIAQSLIPVLASELGVTLNARCDARGTFGRGGGRLVVANSGDASPPRRAECKVFLYRSEALDEHSQRRERAVLALVDWLSSKSAVELEVHRYVDSTNTVNAMLVCGNGRFSRDASWCHQQADHDWTLDALKLVARTELERNSLVSRHHLEQLLLWTALKGESAEWQTETLTRHLTQQIELVAKVLEVRIDIEEQPSGAIVYLKQRKS